MRYLIRLNQYLLLMGIPGLVAISFLDSAAIPLTGGPDAAILLLAWQRPALTFFIVLTAALGSTCGCMVLYGFGRKGGEKVLSRVSAERLARIERRMQEHGIWAIITAVLAPPPFPTKVVILTAGILRTGRARFTAGVFIGRVIRYSMMGYLGAQFGNEAAQIVERHYPTISFALICAVLLVILIRGMLNRGKPASA